MNVSNESGYHEGILTTTDEQQHVKKRFPILKRQQIEYSTLESVAAMKAVEEQLYKAYRACAKEYE